MVEALACGTAVLALNGGSVPEVVHDAVAGFIRETEDELVAVLGRIGELDRTRCREEAERLFSPAALAAAYERVYARVVAHETTEATRPRLSAANAR
jgi:glycosyltransferase involved in cell wall biosynthesis